MMLQWSKMDIGYASYLEFQRRLFIHFAACEADPRSIGQMYTKCRRSGYTNMSAAILVDEGTQVKDKLLGIQSKTGKDAQENIFMKKVVPMFKSYPFFFKPIQDGTTNPRMELSISVSLLSVSPRRTKPQTRARHLIPLSTGRTLRTMHTMVRSFTSCILMRQVSGKNLRIYVKRGVLKNLSYCR
jgi:hypothetical protein